MNYEQFATWLHGFLEISNSQEINKEQTQIIKDHLALLFKKVTPNRNSESQDDAWDQLKKAAEQADKERKKNSSKWPKYSPYFPRPNPPYKPYYLETEPYSIPDKITCQLDTNGISSWNESPKTYC